jgi:hypothetical protein
MRRPSPRTAGDGAGIGAGLPVLTTVTPIDAWFWLLLLGMLGEAAG